MKRKVMAWMLCFTLVLGLVANGNVSFAEENEGLVWENVVDDENNSTQKLAYYESGSKVVNTFKTIDGKLYYFDANGYAKTTGVFEVDGKSYYASGDGSIPCDETIYHVFDDGSHSYYRSKSDGSLYKSEWYVPDEYNTYYYGEDCAQYEEGLFTIDGKQYYFKYSSLWTSEGTFVDNGVNYAIKRTDEGGVEYIQLSEGWNTVPAPSGSYPAEHKYYVKDGVLAAGEMYEIDGEYYWFLGEGYNYLLTDYYKAMTSDGVTTVYVSDMYGKYYRNTWCNNPYNFEEYLYCGDDYKAYNSGFFTIGGNEYYFNADGINARGIIFEHQGKWYYADDNGKLSEISEPDDGWVTTSDGGKFYFENDVMVKNQKKLIDGSYYMFDSSGKLYVNEVCVLCEENGSVLGMGRADADGKLYQSEFYNKNNSIAYYDENCIIMPQGLYTIDGKTYYSDGFSGAIIGEMVTYNGVTYHINNDGTVTKATFPLDEEATKGKVNVFSWNTELGQRIDTILEEYPEYADKIVYWNLNMSGTGAEYIEFINEQSKQNYTSIFCMDSDIIDFQTSKIPYSEFMPVSDIGITEEEYSNSYAYLKQNGMVGEELKFLTWQACPVVFMYNKEIAEEVFGTSDVDAIQALIDTPDEFYATAEKLKAAGYYMTSGMQEGSSMDILLSNCQNMYTPIVGAEDFMSTVNEKGYTSGSAEWSTEWNMEMTSGDKVFGFFVTTWFEWVMPEDMYMICEGPITYKWGGSFVGVTGAENDPEAAEVAEFLLEQLCCDEEMMTKFYTEYLEFPNNKAVVANLISSGVNVGTNTLNNTGKLLSVFDSAARKILKVEVNVEVEKETPKVEIPEETKLALVESIFSDEDRESGLYLEVKFTAEKIEITAIPTEEKNTIETAIKTVDKEVAVVLDLSVLKVLGVSESKVTNLKEPITITVDIPDEFRGKGKHFGIMRLHGGSVDMLADLDNNPNTITFKTDRFSYYTMVYGDEPIVEENIINNETDVTPPDQENNDGSPATGDATPVAFVAMLMVLAIGMLQVLVRRREDA